MIFIATKFLANFSTLRLIPSASLDEYCFYVNIFVSTATAVNKTASVYFQYQQSYDCYYHLTQKNWITPNSIYDWLKFLSVLVVARLFIKLTCE